MEDYMGPIRCCVDPVIERFSDSLSEGIYECYGHTFEMCDVAMCKAVVRGQIAEDGSIIIEKVLKDFSDDPQLTEDIVNYCFAPELRRFYNPEAYSCDMQRLNQCITIQAVLFRLGGCCKDIPRPHKKKFDIMTYGCLENYFRKQKKCGTDLCITKKRGFLNEDLTLNKIALQKEVESEFKDNPDLIKTIVEKCINGVIEDYGEADVCQVTKMRYCIELQSAMTSTSWNEDKTICADINKTIEICKQVI